MTVGRLLMHRPRGFTLVELAIIIVVLGILAAVAIPRFMDMGDSAKVAATQDELNALKVALTGNPRAVAGGSYVDRGFAGDVGHLPNQLSDLATRPDSVASWDRLARLGWNGPYIAAGTGDYLTDAWGVPYVYDRSGRRILSLGGSDTLLVTF